MNIPLTGKQIRVVMRVLMDGQNQLRNALRGPDDELDDCRDCMLERADEIREILRVIREWRKKAGKP